MGHYLVTGASRGIGRRVALDLAGEGHTVYALSRSPAEAPTPAAVRPIACDVGDPTAVAAALERIGGEVEALHGLVNAAGAFRPQRFAEQSLGAVEAMLRVNLLGPVMVTQAALPLLRAAGGAAVVGITTQLIERPTPGVSAYVMAKGGLAALTRSLALELAPDGIRVNAVSPGLVRTDIWRAAGMAPAAIDAFLEQRGRLLPLGRVGEPSDISAAIRFLLDPRNAWITGTILQLDGGLSLTTALPPPAR
jgi:NAD(P)-dependent dehydrogenase (short-subunit alcohol dehydrogenase family)